MPPDQLRSQPILPRPTGAMVEAPVRTVIPPRVDRSVDDIVELVRRGAIRGLHLMHVGGDGCLKSLDFVLQSEDHLRQVLQTGERADGSSLFANTGINPAASDIVLRPRLDTAFLDPFSTEPALAILCRHFDRDGQPLDVSPDTVAHRAFKRVREVFDCDLMALGEVEYFLGRPTNMRDTWGSDDHGYHATSPFVFGADLRRRAMRLLADVGVGVKYGHSEVGWVEADGWTWEQHEIELSLAPLPDAADAVLLTQWVLRNLAHACGMRCSFDPVVREGHAGSGSHFHFSPVRDGEHLGGATGSDELGPEACALIGGLVTAGGALMAWGNRDDSSFVRLAQGRESPETITWGRFNRKALVRIPIQARSADGATVTPPTIEFRLPDGSVHPHLLLAGVAQVMIAARDLEDLDQKLRDSEAGNGREGAPIPRDPATVAARLEEYRAWFEAAGVLPVALIEAELTRLYD